MEGLIMEGKGEKYLVRKINESDKIDPNEPTVKANLVPEADVVGQSYYVSCPYCGASLTVGYRACNWICPNCGGRFCAY